jgi:glycosyltransferase involved in cell wall biosynthesis
MQRVEKSILWPAVREARVIPNGVDRSIFYPPSNRASVRQRLGIDQTSLVLASSAYNIRNNQWKDYATLHSAFAHLGQTWHGKTLICLALGAEAPPEEIGRLKIRFVPFLKSAIDVAQYIQAADLYVHSARVDTFPNAVIEALSCGLPVVATAVGGIPEQIDSETGFLVPPKDAISMASRIEFLLVNDDLRKRMGAAGAEAGRQRFDMKLQVDQYLEWYREITLSEQKFDKTCAAIC